MWTYIAGEKRLPGASPPVFLLSIYSPWYSAVDFLVVAYPSLPTQS